MLPIVVSIPHCSNFIPPSIREKMMLTDHQIASYSDLYTDRIFDLSNCHLVKARASRLVVDPNRAGDFIITENHLAHEGAVVQITEDEKPIYKEHDLPSEQEIKGRIEEYHDTFHRQVEELTSSCQFLIDGHSYKSVGPSTKHDAGKERADICLGNRDFTTCNREQTNFFYTFFERLGYSVAVNDPYEGKYILGYHCNRNRFPGLQIEVNRKLYMNEETLDPYDDRIATINRHIYDLTESFAERFLSK